MEAEKNMKVLLVPPPQLGGGPSNAIIRCSKVLAENGVNFTTKFWLKWDKALLNVSVGLRFKFLKISKFNRKFIYRADGCYVKSVFEKEGNPWLPEYDYINNNIKNALQEADHVIFQSNHSKNYLDQLYPRKTGTYTIAYNGVDLNIFNYNRSGKNEVPAIGCIGKFRLNRLQIIKNILMHVPFKHKLLLVGRIEPDCVDHLKEIKLLKNTTLEYVGQIYGDEELAKLHNKIDCFLHPFVSDTCPNSVIEALACGTPVVLVEGTGGNELMGGGGIAVNRWTLKSDIFYEETAAAIEVIFKEWSFYSTQARERAIEALDVKQMADQYLIALKK